MQNLSPVVGSVCLSRSLSLSLYLSFSLSITLFLSFLHTVCFCRGIMPVNRICAAHRKKLSPGFVLYPKRGRIILHTPPHLVLSLALSLEFMSALSLGF